MVVVAVLIYFQLENLRSQQAQIAEHQHLLHDIRISDAEEMCQLKNKLENEIQVTVAF